MGYVFTFTAFENNSNVPLKRYEYAGSWCTGTMENLFNEIRNNAMNYELNLDNSLILYTYTIQYPEVETLFHAFTKIQNGSQTTWSDEYSKGMFERLYEVIVEAYSKDGIIKVELD